MLANAHIPFLGFYARGVKCKIFAILFVFLAVILFFAQGILFPADSGSKETAIFKVQKGQGALVVGAELEKQKLVRSRLFFDAAVILKRGERRLQAGQYEISRAMPALEIAKKMINGEIAVIKTTFPEGLAVSEMEEKLKKQSQSFSFKNFKAVDFKNSFDFLADAPSFASLEGFLFPDTYEFSYDLVGKEVAKAMLANFNQNLSPALRNEIKRQNKTIFEIVTMASLLEKEVRTLEEKKLVSGILWKRLRVGMRLQVDATIVYALDRNPGKISFEMTQVDSLYNTYRYAGLPPGPICNPGLDSIKAAIYPQQSDYWYYLSTPEGKTLFSQTLAEHNVKKVKYLNK